MLSSRGESPPLSLRPKSADADDGSIESTFVGSMAAVWDKVCFAPLECRSENGIIVGCIAEKR
jgi:hypothetical protein